MLRFLCFIRYPGVGASDPSTARVSLSMWLPPFAPFGFCHALLSPRVLPVASASCCCSLHGAHIFSFLVLQIDTNAFPLTMTDGCSFAAVLFCFVLRSDASAKFTIQTTCVFIVLLCSYQSIIRSSSCFSPVLLRFRFGRRHLS